MGQPFVDPYATADASYGVGVPEQLGRQWWSPWDKMTIGGIEVPGTVKVFGRKTRRTDVRSSAGNSMATLTNLGYDPTEIDITITIWTPSQMADYEALLAKVQPKPLPPRSTLSATNVTTGQPTTVVIVNKPMPVSAYHPALAIMGVSAIYVHDVGLLVQGPQPQTLVTTWRAAEFSPLISGLADPFTAALDSYLGTPPSNRPAPTQPTTRPDQDATTLGPN